MRRRRLPLPHYLAATGITAAAVGLRILLEPLWGTSAPFVLLYPAVMLSAWIGGLGPGLLATGLGAAAAQYFWFGPYRSFGVPSLADAALLCLFLVVCVGTCA